MNQKPWRKKGIETSFHILIKKNCQSRILYSPTKLSNDKEKIKVFSEKGEDVSPADQP